MKKIIDSIDESLSIIFIILIIFAMARCNRFDKIEQKLDNIEYIISK